MVSAAFAVDLIRSRDQAKSCWSHHGSPQSSVLVGTTNAKCQWILKNSDTPPCVCSTHIHVFTIVAHTHVIAVGLCPENQVQS